MIEYLPDNPRNKRPHLIGADVGECWCKSKWVPRHEVESYNAGGNLAIQGILRHYDKPDGECPERVEG